MKEQAKKIVSSISQGKENVIMTVVHVSVAVNILKHGMPQDQLTMIIRGLFMLDNVEIIDATRDAYFAGIELCEDLKLEANDALAVDIMRQKNIDEISHLMSILITLKGSKNYQNSKHDCSAIDTYSRVILKS